MFHADYNIQEAEWYGGQTLYKSARVSSALNAIILLFLNC